MDNKKVIYTADNGGDYTEKRFRDEVETWMKNSDLFNDLTSEQFKKASDHAFKMVLSAVEWECPSTYCEQFEDEDFEEILENSKV